MRRRVFLQLVSALPAVTVMPWGCGDNDRRFFNATERRVLAACANVIFPPDEHSPGAAELGAVEFIENLMTAFDHDPPHILAAVPFSNRNPFPDVGFPPAGFRQVLPLSRVHETSG